MELSRLKALGAEFRHLAGTHVFVQCSGFRIQLDLLGFGVQRPLYVLKISLLSYVESPRQ